LGKAPALAKKHQAFMDEFDFEDDHAQKSVIGNPSSKYSKAEQHLNDFYKEEKEGFKVSQQKFQVNVYGMPRATEDNSDNISEEIDEEVVTDREHHNEPHAAITVSQSLGVDPSVDSLALDDYDHIEPVNWTRVIWT